MYLEAIAFTLHSKVGSRGSSIVVDTNGEKIHEMLDEGWSILPEDPMYRSKVLETEVKHNGVVQNEWIDCHPAPEIDSWFETTWADFRKGEIYKTE